MNNINIKDYLKLTFYLIPFYATIGCIILWSYLGEIGRLTLFTSILDSTPSLLAITFAFSLLTISVLCIFTLPSFLLYSFTLMKHTDTIRRVIKVGRIPWIAFATSTLFIAIIITASIPGKLPGWLSKNLVPILFSGLYLLILFSVHFFSNKRKKPVYFFTGGKKSNSIFFVKEKALISLVILFSSFSIVIPFQFVLGISSAFKDTGVINLALISLPLIFISFLPAIFLFSGRDYRTNQKPMAFTLIATIFIFILCMLLIPGFSSVISRGALKKVGVIETSSHIYAIEKTRYPIEMFPAPFWEKEEKKSDKYIFIQGTILLSVGGKVLLCPDFVINAQNKYLKYNLDNLFSPRNDFHTRYIKQTMRSCALVNSSEITPWDGIIDGENTANR